MAILLLCIRQDTSGIRVRRIGMSGWFICTDCQPGYIRTNSFGWKTFLLDAEQIPEGLCVKCHRTDCGKLIFGSESDPELYDYSPFIVEEELLLELGI